MALLVETPVMRRSGLLEPKGSRWVRYPAPVQAQPAPRPRQSRRTDTPTAVRWAISTPARPPVTAAVAMADALRAACQSQHGKTRDREPSMILAGKAADSTPLEGHAHAHYLAEDEDDDGLLDTLIVWAPGGLGQGELEALAGCSELHEKNFLSAEDYRPCHLGLEAVGDIAVVAPKLAGPSRVWRSFTPFAPTRHQKRHQDTDAFVEQQIRLELSRRDRAEPAAVSVLTQGLPHQPLAFRRYRIKEGLRDARRAFHVEIVFTEPEPGPLALGALSHFGLGLFLPHTKTRAA